MEAKKEVEKRMSLNLIDITSNQFYTRVSPFKCVISNAKFDFIVHTIFVIGASDYFQTLYENTDEQCEIEPGVFVPRLRVHFANNLLEEYLRFAYFDTMEVTTENVEQLLEFASFLNSIEMLAIIEKVICGLVDSLLESGAGDAAMDVDTGAATTATTAKNPTIFDQLKDYSSLAEMYLLDVLAQKLRSIPGTYSTTASIAISGTNTLSTTTTTTTTTATTSASPVTSVASNSSSITGSGITATTTVANAATSVSNMEVV